MVIIGTAVCCYSTERVYEKLQAVLEVLKQHFQGAKDEDTEKCSDTLFSKLGEFLFS